MHDVGAADYQDAFVAQRGRAAAELAAAHFVGGIIHAEPAYGDICPRVEHGGTASGRARPRVVMALVKGLSSAPFIGEPWPMNNAGILLPIRT